MAVRVDQHPPHVPDVDDQNLDKIKDGKKPSTNRRNRAQVRANHEDKASARKPGKLAVTPGEHDEEHHLEEEALAQQRRERVDPDGQTKKLERGRPITRPGSREGRGGGGDGQEQREEQKPKTQSLSELAADRRVDLARQRGFQQTPSVGEVVQGKQQLPTGPSFAELLPDARARKGPGSHTVRPAGILSRFEAMKDVYLKLKGRASPKTKALLEGPDLEDLVRMLGELLENEDLKRSAEGRVRGAIHAALRADPGPLLLGLTDERLADPWKLFVDGWDIWVPPIDKEDPNAEETGVELFIEGEGEDEDGEPIEISQSIVFKGGEIRFETVFGAERDELTFDGTTFYRQKKR